MTKRINDIVDGVCNKDAAHKEYKAALDTANFEIMNERQLEKEVNRIERRMHDAAKNLEFEYAAEFGDHPKMAPRAVLRNRSA